MVDNLRALTYRPSCHCKEMDLIADEAVFVGCTENSYTYFFSNWSCPRILQKSRNITFFEDCFSTLNNRNDTNTKTSTGPLVLSNSLPIQEETVQFKSLL